VALVRLGYRPGAAILALFALIEKRRNDLLAIVDRIRQWD